MAVEISYTDIEETIGKFEKLPFKRKQEIITKARELLKDFDRLCQKEDPFVVIHKNYKVEFGSWLIKDRILEINNLLWSVVVNLKINDVLPDKSLKHNYASGKREKLPLIQKLTQGGVNIYYVSTPKDRVNISYNKAIQKVLPILEEYPGVSISGETGTGKTTMAIIATANYLKKHKMATFKFIDFKKIVGREVPKEKEKTEIIGSVFIQEYSTAPKKYYSKVIVPSDFVWLAADVLILDDIFDSFTLRELKLLEYIVDTRLELQNMLPKVRFKTIFTGNFDLLRLYTDRKVSYQYGIEDFRIQVSLQRIISRIEEIVGGEQNLLKTTGENWRAQGK